MRCAGTASRTESSASGLGREAEGAGWADATHSELFWGQWSLSAPLPWFNDCRPWSCLKLHCVVLLDVRGRRSQLPTLNAHVVPPVATEGTTLKSLEPLNAWQPWLQPCTSTVWRRSCCATRRSWLARSRSSVGGVTCSQVVGFSLVLVDWWLA